MNDKQLQETLNFAIDLATKAGRIMVSYFNSATLESSYKLDKTIVTNADIEINSLAIEAINKHFPHCGIYG